MLGFEKIQAIIYNSYIVMLLLVNYNKMPVSANDSIPGPRPKAAPDLEDLDVDVNPEDIQSSIGIAPDDEEVPLNRETTFQIPSDPNTLNVTEVELSNLRKHTFRSLPTLWYVANSWLGQLHRYRRDEAQSWLKAFNQDQRNVAHSWFRELHRHRRDMALSWLTRFHRRRRSMFNDPHRDKSSNTPIHTGHRHLAERPVPFADHKLFNRLHEIVVRCLPTSDQMPSNGYYRIDQYNNFTVVCDEGFSNPLSTFSSWSCSSSHTFDLHYTIPTMCVEKHLPLFVTMSRRAKITGLKNSGCGNYADLKGIQSIWKKVILQHGLRSFKIDDFEFYFNAYPQGGWCNGSFFGDNYFTMSVSVDFVVEHSPVAYKFGEATRKKVQAHLDSKVENTLGIMSRKKLLDSYRVSTNLLLFKAEHCGPEGSALEITEEFFMRDIPPCRVCDRGMYLCPEHAVCVRCARGHYSPGRGATKCYPCPITDREETITGDSLHDCFALPKCERCKMIALREGILIVTIYHLVCLIVAAWNLRITIPNGKKQHMDKGSQRKSSA